MTPFEEIKKEAERIASEHELRDSKDWYQLYFGITLG